MEELRINSKKKEMEFLPYCTYKKIQVLTVATIFEFVFGTVRTLIWNFVQ